MKRTFAVVLVISLFFLWGFAHNLNPILIPHLKKALQLSDFQSAFVDSSFFLAYFTMALPAGFFMKKFGYKAGIITGLLLFSAGAMLFLPAADVRTFGLFLLALFIIASGLTFLETAANPYIIALGDAQTGTQRLNLAQSFNGLAATVAPLIGGTFILTGKQFVASENISSSGAELQAFLNEEAAQVKLPYLIISLFVLAVAIIFWRLHLPKITEEEEMAAEKPKGSIWKHKNLITGIVTQFFYVGAQVGISSFFIRFLGKTAEIPEKSAAYYLSIALLFFMIGRFVGTFLMKYFEPRKLLLSYSIACIALLLVAISAGGMISVYCLIGVEFFMSIMFPTIFSLSIVGLGTHSKLGSSLLIMSIVGGAIIPLIMGKVSDASSIQIAYIVPAICFLFVTYFSITTGKKLIAIQKG